MSASVGLPVRTPSRARRGIVLVYLTLMLVALLAIASLAVDWGRVQLAKTETQGATDAAARYGVTGVPAGPATVRERVAYAAARNAVDGTPLVIDPASDVEFGTWNPTTKTFAVLTGSAESSATAIRVTGRRVAARGTAVPLAFASLLGTKSCDVSASAVASFGSQSNDIFVVQDVTTSFIMELSRAKSGLQDLLSKLHSSGSPSRMAIAVHTGWGKTLAPFTPVASNYTYLSSTISSIQLNGFPGMPKVSGTDVSVGLDEALDAFRAPGYVAPSGKKAVVLISDGQPTQDANAKNSSQGVSQLKGLAQARANLLWSRGVHVYVVFMDKSNDAVAAAFLKSLVRGDGDFARVTQGSDLPAAVADLTKRIGGVELVK